MSEPSESRGTLILRARSRYIRAMFVVETKHLAYTNKGKTRKF